MRTAIQLYSVREIDEPLPTLLERIAETPFDGVEVGSIDADVDEVANAAEANGLEIAGRHVGIDAFENSLDDVVDVCERLGCENYLVPWLGRDQFESVAAIETTADRLSTIASDLPENATLHYHNHGHEFDEVDGRPAVDHLFEHTVDVEFEIDLGWAGQAGHDPVEVLERHVDHVSLLHVKDYDAETREETRIGDGDLDMARCAEIARENGVEWLIYEYEDDPSNFGVVEHGAEELAQYSD